MGMKEAAKNEQRGEEKDSRTLYVCFQNEEKLPQNENDVKKLHDGIQMVRTHQLKKTLTEENVTTKTNKVRKIKYVYIEFDSEETCEEAKVALEKNCDLFVDYVGIKSTVEKRDNSEKEV